MKEALNTHTHHCISQLHCQGFFFTCDVSEFTDVSSVDSALSRCELSHSLKHNVVASLVRRYLNQSETKYWELKPLIQVEAEINRRETLVSSLKATYGE